MSRRGRSLLWMCWIASAGCQPSPVLNPLAGLGGVGGAPTSVVVSGAGGSSGVVAGAGSAGTTASAPVGDLPCPVAALLEMHCIECHAHQPRLGAPMSLVDAASFRAQRSGQTVAALVAMRVVRQRRGFHAPLDVARRERCRTAFEWTKAGAVPAANGCIVHDPFEDADTAGQSGSVAMQPVAGAAGESAAGAAGSAGVGAAPPTRVAIGVCSVAISRTIV